MSATTAPRTSRLPSPASESLAALARADARRFARHPLFLSGVAVLVSFLALAMAQGYVDAAPMETVVLPAFFLGVFGFVVAHRLTTSLRRSHDLADTAPVSQQRRTLALCLACLVPMSAGVLALVVLVAYNAVWQPDGSPAGQPVSWFRDEPDMAILAALVATIPLAALGGPLLGVAVARWAPFRGSALLGMVVLTFVVAYAMELPDPWNALSPFVNFGDTVVTGGVIRSSWLRDGVSPAWWCLYGASLCGLAVVTALLRDKANRRPLLAIGGVIAATAVGSFLLAVA